MNCIESLVAGIGKSQSPAGMSTRVIAIDGPGGAGKSSLALKLAVALNHPTLIHTDDFASWDVPTEWWPRLIEQVLEPLSRNRPAHYQRYNWDRQTLAEWHDVVPAEFLILEGVSASREAFQPYLAFSVWVETPRDERLRRGLERDGEDALPLWIGWMEGEDQYVERERPAERANVVVDGMLPFEA
jgi:uridine kinase